MKTAIGYLTTLAIGLTLGIGAVAVAERQAEPQSQAAGKVTSRDVYDIKVLLRAVKYAEASHERLSTSHHLATSAMAIKVGSIATDINALQARVESIYYNTNRYGTRTR